MVPGRATALVPTSATVLSRHQERLSSCKGNAPVPGVAKVPVSFILLQDGRPHHFRHYPQKQL